MVWLPFGNLLARILLMLATLELGVVCIRGAPGCFGFQAAL